MHVHVAHTPTPPRPDRADARRPQAVRRRRERCSAIERARGAARAHGGAAARRARLSGALA
eukprot:616959-Prymnesium_polylepis.2